MSAPTKQAAEGAAAVPPSRRHRPKRRRRVVITAGVVVMVTAVAGGGYYAVAKLHKNTPAPSADPYPTKLVPVVRESLSEQTSVNGTLGYSGSYTVVVPSDSSGSPSSGSSGSPGASGSFGSGSSSGTFTWLPGAGHVVRDGQRLYSVSNSPVMLLYGSVPVYRSLSEGMSGPDVKQLNSDLVALGDASRTDLDPSSRYFSSETATALEKLQSKLGLPQTGTLPVGQAVFEPSAVRVGRVTATHGAPVDSGSTVLTGTSDTRRAVAQVDPTNLPDVKVGARATITLPNDDTTTGVVTSIATTATGSGGGSESSGGSSAPAATVNVGIRLNHPAAAGTLDQAPVTVNITTTTVNNVLAVPVDALVTQPSGYGVEVAGRHGTRHIVPVTIGPVFDDARNLVQVAGQGLAAGQQVVVPSL
jgi:hypothetical protein